MLRRRWNSGSPIILSLVCVRMGGGCRIRNFGKKFPAIVERGTLSRRRLASGEPPAPAWTSRCTGDERRATLSIWGGFPQRKSGCLCYGQQVCDLQHEACAYSLHTTSDATLFFGHQMAQDSTPVNI